jgi:hypothetical protein
MGYLIQSPTSQPTADHLGGPVENEMTTTVETPVETEENDSSRWWGAAPVVIGGLVFLASNGGFDGLTGNISSSGSLEKAISANASNSLTGAQMNVQDVECAETYKPNWYLCSWRTQGASDVSIRRVEVEGSMWQSGAPFARGSVADLSQQLIDSII